MDTAEKHLAALVEEGAAVEHKRTSPYLYGPDASYVNSATFRDLLESHDLTELMKVRNQLQSRVNAFRDECGVHSPIDLTESSYAAHEWGLVEYRLSILMQRIGEQYRVLTSLSGIKLLRGTDVAQIHRERIESRFSNSFSVCSRICS